MTRDVYIIDAKRSPVAPRGGEFSNLSITDLCTPLIASLRNPDALTSAPDIVMVGNALYGGGNPARLLALASGLQDSTPAMTIDTQCCAGMDAILLAADAIKVGRARHALAGGVESYSRAPIRMHRGFGPNAEHTPYDRPPFTPWADRDPDMITAAADLAASQCIPRSDQERFAILSHTDARVAHAAGAFATEMVPIVGVSSDVFTRNLTSKLCQRLPGLAGETEYAITTATTAVEADAAAFVTLSTDKAASRPAIRIRDSVSFGAEPEMPGLAPIEATRILLERNQLQPGDVARIEIMEAFAAQAIAFIDAFQFPNANVNVSGGALARGHPIGASGAILVVRLCQELSTLDSGSIGLAAIAGAGGLASCILLDRV